MENFIDPIKVGFGHYLQRFHKGLFPVTAGLQEFSAREFSKSAVWAPGRMIDQVESMLESWRKNDNADSSQPRPYLPVMIAAMSKDFLPAPPEFTRVVPDDMYVMLPDDPKERIFKLRMASVDVRIQVAIMAQEGPTAYAIALQLDLFAKASENRTFFAPFKLAGFSEAWPMTLEMPELQGISTPVGDTKNLSINTVDIQARGVIPLLRGPGPGEKHDGKGAGTEDDPHGYPATIEARGTNGPSSAYAHPETWREVSN